MTVSMCIYLYINILFMSDIYFTFFPWHTQMEVSFPYFLRASPRQATLWLQNWASRAFEFSHSQQYRGASGWTLVNSSPSVDSPAHPLPCRCGPVLVLGIEYNSEEGKENNQLLSITLC